MSEIGVIRLESELFPVAKIHTFGTIANGGTPTSREENWNGDIPFITPPDLNGLDGEEVTSVGRTITESGLESGSNLVKNGVIISGRAPVGYVGLVTTPSAFNQGCKVICTDQDHRYVAYALAASKSNLQVLANGTTFSEISSTSVANYAIPLPPLETQQRIADYLDRETAEIDAAVADLDRYVELLEKRRSVLITEVVTDQIVNGSTREVSLKHYVEINPLTDEFKILSENEEVTFLPLENIWSGGKTDYSTKRPWRKSDTSYTQFRRGDVLVPKVTPTVFHGRSTVAETETEVGLATSEVHVLRPKKSVEAKWVAYNVLSSQFLDRARGEVYGVGGLQRISAGYLGSYKVMETDLVNQQRIADYLDRETAEIDSLIEESTKLRNLLLKRRSVLITDAVTGRKQV